MQVYFFSTAGDTNTVTTSATTFPYSQQHHRSFNHTTPFSDQHSHWVMVCYGAAEVDHSSVYTWLRPYEAAVSFPLSPSLPFPLSLTFSPFLSFLLPYLLHSYHILVYLSLPFHLFSLYSFAPILVPPASSHSHVFLLAIPPRSFSSP